MTNKEYFETMADLFQHKGWKKLVEDTTLTQDALKDALVDPKLTMEEIRIVQGRLIGINDLLNLQSLIEGLEKQEKEAESE